MTVSVNMELLENLYENSRSGILKWKKTSSGKSEEYTARLSEDAWIRISHQYSGPLFSENIILEVHHSSYSNYFGMRLYSEIKEVANLLKALFDLVAQRPSTESVSVIEKISGYVSVDTALVIVEQALGKYRIHESNEEVSTDIPEWARRAFPDES